MDDEIETLMVDVRASTSGFRSDVEEMRSRLDTTLVDGFARAGDVLERGLLSALRRGQLGFDDLKQVALRTLGEIAAQAVRGGFGQLFGGGAGASQGLGGALGQAVGTLLGLPGRATGGPVGPGSAYLVGERGPEIFVPTASGRIAAPERAASGGPRDVRVSINLPAARGGEAPVMLRRSSRQVASAIARALREA